MALDVEDARVTLTGLRLMGRVGVQLQGHLAARNVMFGRVDAVLGTDGGMFVSDSTLELLYATVHGDVSCYETSDGIAIRNSLITGGDDVTIDCEGAQIVDTVTFDDRGTVDISNPDPNFGWFADTYVADLHLTEDAPIGLAVAGSWREGDPSTDIDGDPRPTLDPSSDWVGADRPEEQ